MYSIVYYCITSFLKAQVQALSSPHQFATEQTEPGFQGYQREGGYLKVLRIRQKVR